MADTEEQAPAEPGPALRRSARIGLFLGPTLFLFCLAIPAASGLTPQARAMLGVVALMATWWATEAIPIGATAFVPLVLFPLLGILGPIQTAAPYADPNVFLFLGGFLLAQAFQKWGLDRRLALHVLVRVGTRPRRLLLGFMGFTALVSMWVSNTATTLIMLPLGLGVLAQLGARADRTSGRRDPFGTVLMLGIAYAASIGGMATLIGTPPNIILAGAASQALPQGPEVTFVRWMIVGVPLALVFLVVAWAFLAFARLASTRTKPDPGVGVALRTQLQDLGRTRRPEWLVMCVFFLTVAAWVFRTELDLQFVRIPGWSDALGTDIHDGTIAMAAALLLFLLPTDWRRHEFVLDWKTAMRVPWEIVFLFGGGFALAAGFRATGLDTWVGQNLAAASGVPTLALIFGLCVFMTLASEVASNTALAAVTLPILAAAATSLGIHPLWLMVPAALAASSGFMLPVATPPNAIAFASGHVRMRHMVRAGVWLDLIGAVLITLMTWLLLPLAFGLPWP